MGELFPGALFCVFRNKRRYGSVVDTVEELLTQFEEYLTRLALASSTIVNYLTDLRAFARWHVEAKGSAVSLLELTPEDIREYRRHMQTCENWSPATINRRLQAIRKFYHFTTEKGLTENNPASEVRLIPTSRPNPPRILAPDEVARLLEAVQGGRPSLVKRDYAILQLLLQTGIKLGELTELRLSDVQLWGNGEGLLLVGEGDGHGGRQIPLNSVACAALQEYLEVRPSSAVSDKLFLSQDGNRISKRTVQRLVSLYAEAAGLEDVSTYVLRHTFAVSTLADTGDVSLVARLLGHRCRETTAKYLPACEQYPTSDTQ